MEWFPALLVLYVIGMVFGIAFGPAGVIGYVAVLLLGLVTLLLRFRIEEPVRTDRNPHFCSNGDCPR